MRRVVTGLCALVWSIQAVSIAAQPVQEDDELQTREVVISATRLPDTPVDARTLPAKVTVITAEDIQKAGARTVQEAVQWATGIVMYDQVGNAFQQTIDLRGFNGQSVSGTSVLVDGMRMNEPDFNQVNFELIPLETIERIEIIPGSSAIYGRNAMGGVINIITKRGTNTHQVTGETLWGSFHRERYNISASGPIGKFDYYTSFSRELEDGFRDESDARLSRFFGKIGYRPSEGSDYTVSYNYVKSRILQAGSLPLSQAAIDRKRNFTPGDFDDKETNVVRFNGRQALPLGFSITTNAFYRTYGQELYNVGQTSQSSNPVKTESKGGVFQLNHEVKTRAVGNNLVTGFEYTRTDFGSRLASTSGFGPFNNRKDTNETNMAFYAQDTFNIFSKVFITGGVRYDRTMLESDFEDSFSSPDRARKVFHRVTPRAGLTYVPTRDTSLYFNYSQGFRVPTADELFALGPFTSNPNLRAVQSHSYEVGLKQKIGDKAEASVALFRIDAKDDIFFTCQLCDFSFGDGLNRNIDKTRRQGIESTVKVRPNQYVDTTINYTYTQAEYRTGFNVTSTRRVDAGDSLPLVPKHRISMVTNVYPAEGWTVSLMGLYVSTQFHLNDENNAQPRLPGYFLLNAKLNYERPVPGGRLSTFLIVNNLLDQRYSTSGIIASNVVTGGGAQERFVVPAPGIAIYGGLSYRFELSALQGRSS